MIPPGGVVYVARDSKAFRSRSESPKGGEGLLVVSGLKVVFGGEIVLLDAEGGASGGL